MSLFAQNSIGLLRQSNFYAHIYKKNNNISTN